MGMKTDQQLRGSISVLEEIRTDMCESGILSKQHESISGPSEVDPLVGTVFRRKSHPETIAWLTFRLGGL